MDFYTLDNINIESLNKLYTRTYETFLALAQEFLC